MAQYIWEIPILCDATAATQLLDLKESRLHDRTAVVRGNRYFAYSQPAGGVPPFGPFMNPPIFTYPPTPNQDDTDTHLTGRPLAAAEVTLPVTKEARVLAYVGSFPLPTAESIPIIKEFVFGGGGFLIEITSGQQFVFWSTLFGSVFPVASGFVTAIERYEGIGSASSVIENGRFGLVDFTNGQQNAIGTLAPFPKFGEPQGNIRLIEDGTDDPFAMYSTFEYGTGRVAIYNYAHLNLGTPGIPQDFSPFQPLLRNIMAWLNKQWPIPA